MKKVLKSVLIKREKRLAKRLFKKEYLKAKKDMFIRDKGCCVFCNKPVSKDHYQTCHIIPKEFKETHNDLNNLLLACFYHHKVGKYSMHNHPLWFVRWLFTHRKEQYDYLMTKLKDINLEPLNA